jgi:hypothetical protein
VRAVRVVLACTTLAVANAAGAQPEERTLTPLETAVACAPPTSLEVPADPLRIVGAQDTVRRVIFDAGDQLVVGAGSRRDVRIGQQYFVRRPIISGSDRSHPRAIDTLGWIRIVAVNENTAIARMDHFCGGVYAGDYLEPFVAPALAPDLIGDEPVGDVNFSRLSHVVGGPETRIAAGSGGLMLIDRGADQDTTPGLRFGVYRDLREPGMPLASVGEGVVLSVGKSMSLVRITRSRDAVVAGDYVVPRK